MILDVGGRDRCVAPASPPHYRHHTFEVPTGTTCLRVELAFVRREAHLFLSLFDAEGRYRGTRMKPFETGALTLELELGEGGASLGALPGPLPAGTWRVLVDVLRAEREATTDYRLTVTTSSGPVESPPLQAAPIATGKAPTASGPRYYGGELHAHSHHSDGTDSVATVVGRARAAGLDFLALTDHVTSAGWAELARHAAPDFAVLPGLELTGHAGHANLHGLRDWVDVFADPCTPGGRNINAVADDAHAQGALFSVNHAFCIKNGWRYDCFDWSRCDLFEIFHHIPGCDNLAQLGFWDHLLRRGYRITGVGATDYHRPGGAFPLGSVRTHVYSETLTPASLLGGLRSGRAFVSLGPTLELRATSGRSQAFMGGHLAVDGAVQLEGAIANLAVPGRLFVLKNGLPFAFVDLPACPEGSLDFCFGDTPRGEAFYRLELYAQRRDTPGRTGRAWTDTLLLSNPIFVTAPERP